jgi:potassium-transporting ATPase KdpC subunit
MATYFKPALMMFLLMTAITGVVYPLAVTGIAQLLFPEQANGSLMKDRQGSIVGSALIGQNFQGRGYFWSRPSATSPYAYNATASGGSNLGPLNPVLSENIMTRIKSLKSADTESSLSIPVDLVTASASGLDPHISPAAAVYQLKRIAVTRHLMESDVQKLVDRYTENRQWGLLGEPRVNVLLMNLALDESYGKRE